MRTASGGLIDRNTPLRFRFDGRDYRGFSGDTLASALLANNIKLVGRSFKYHRPRGILTAGPVESNAQGLFRSWARGRPHNEGKTVEIYYRLEGGGPERSVALHMGVLAG